MKTNGTKKLSKAIVRNMFDTILNPIFFNLKFIEELLQTNNLTWEPFNQNFTEIGNFQSSFDYIYSLNFEQLVATEFNELLDLSLEFDQTKALLNTACINLYNSLIKSPEISQLLNETINEYENNALISKSNIDYIREANSISWIAKFLINNIKELPDSHYIHKLWNSEYSRFFAILEYPDYLPLKNNLEHRISEFKNITQKSLNEIRTKMFELSIKYGESIVSNINQ